MAVSTLRLRLRCYCSIARIIRADSASEPLPQAKSRDECGDSLGTRSSEALGYADR